MYQRMPHDLLVSSISRRDMLRGSALFVMASAFGLTNRNLFAQTEPVRLEQPNAGTAGALWPTLLKRKAANNTHLSMQWLGGDPGQSQVQLLAGAIDVGFFGPIGAAETALRGKDVVIFAPGLLNHGSWIVRGDSSFRSPQDLKGKRIASQPETTETYRQARLAASFVGLDLRRDFQMIFGPPIANYALFERGDVDAVITIEPISSRLIAGGAREIVRVSTQWQHGTQDAHPLFLGGQGATRDWFDKNRVTAHELARLYVEVNQQIRSNPQVIRELHQLLGVPAEERNAIDLLAKRLPEFYAVDWSPAVAAGADQVLSLAVRNGILRAKPTRPVLEVA